MNKIILFITMIFVAGRVKAQNEFRQLTLGVGAGAATAYAGTPIIKTTLAYNANICYYPAEFFDVALEGQIGQLAGGKIGTSHLNFNNKYQAIILEPVLQFGALLYNSQNDFLNTFKHFYFGTGFGYIHNRVTNINFGVPQYSRDIIPLIPVKLGYEFNIVDDYNNPILKINLSYSFNTTVGLGLDGYHGTMPQSTKFYAYYGIQVEYPINLIQNYGRGRLKF